MTLSERNSRAVEHLQQAIRLRTTSYFEKEKIDFGEYEKFMDLLKRSYPSVHERTELTVINGYSLVYRWRGMQNDGAPTMFMAHYDVVPVEEGTEGDWKHDAFSGELAEGRIWGRGTLDIKSQLIAILETAEDMISAGFEPKNDIYFCFGHDEEVSGEEGAGKIAEYLKAKGLRFETIYDEGGAVIMGAVDGVKSPLAVIGVAEKGYCDIKITVEGKGGHSSTPPESTALGTLAKIVCELERCPMKAALTPPVLAMFRNISPEMGFVVKTLVSGHKVFRPILIKALSSGDMTNAMIRTTLAFTMCGAGDAANVLPQSAYAVANARLLPGDTGEALMAHLKGTVDKYGAKAEILQLTEASSISPENAVGYERLHDTIAKFFTEAIITPYLVMGGTDSSKYQCLCDNIYRFTPYHITSAEQETMHNTDESLSEEGFCKMMDFYAEMFEEL